MFLTTHYLEEADELCDRLMIIDHGQIVAEGAPPELKRQIAGDTVLLSATTTTTPPSAPSERLRPQPYVRELSADGSELRLYVDDGGSALPEILRLLDHEQISAQSISVSEPTLDDVFLRQTGRSLRDAGDPEPDKESTP